MGFSPRQVGEMSLWQFWACVEGYGKANGWKASSGGGDLTEARLAEMGIEGFT